MTPPAERAGLQAQRTSLGWSRTALALIVTMLLVLRAGIRSGEIAIQALSATVSIASAGFLIIAVLRTRQLRAAKITAPSSWMIAGAAMVLCLEAMAGVVALLFSTS